MVQFAAMYRNVEIVRVDIAGFRWFEIKHEEFEGDTYGSIEEAKADMDGRIEALLT